MSSVKSGSVYIVAGSKPWNRRVFDEVIAKLPGEWHFIGSPQELTPEYVRKINPRYIFFLHWSWRVPPDIIKWKWKGGYESR